ncbi:MAG: hypothetical protein M0D57_19520 [Sphingobacteriales bacterium JAD_PAG50586_3]|nr:MAG: hypothetical protein M0D57_19520 [Sphingobacteriales bacterium JAD_PAG50586_3]
MLDYKKIIEGINSSCKPYFTESVFKLQPSSLNRFSISGDNLFKAINNYDKSKEEINVLKWFDDFWIYIDIKFIDKNTFISISVFQGADMDKTKHQLFRAEWDDYNNTDEKHPQPHWHITSNQAIENTFEELAAVDDSDTFVNLLQQEKSKIININKIHFAMNGNWINDDSHVHALNNEGKIIKWFQGILSHLKDQLLYVKM